MCSTTDPLLATFKIELRCNHALAKIIVQKNLLRFVTRVVSRVGLFASGRVRA